MAWNTSAWGNDGNTYGERSMRELVAALTGGFVGVIGTATALKISQQAAPANTVKAAAGGIVIAATAAGESGSYTDWNNADLTSPVIAPTGAGVSRLDRIIARVTAGVTALEVVAGTAAASPVEPAITGDNWQELALVTMPASTTNITDAMITDRRTRLATGVPVICKSTTRPASPYEGLVIYETDTNRTFIWEGAEYHRIDAKSNRYEATGSGTTSGTTELTLATLVVPAGPNYPYQLELSGLAVSTNMTVANDIFELRIKDGATVLRKSRMQAYAANTSGSVVIPNATVAVPAGGTKTITLVLVRVSGTGTATVDPGLVATLVGQVIPT